MPALTIIARSLISLVRHSTSLFPGFYQIVKYLSDGMECSSLPAKFTYGIDSVEFRNIFIACAALASTPNVDVLRESKRMLLYIRS